jgi:hypothetical protein
MRSRNRSHDDVASGGGDLESWISGLTGGETSVRRLRERLVADGGGPEGTCEVCERAATGEVHPGHDSYGAHEGHARGRLTA